jgi:hypothetical protein
MAAWMVGASPVPSAVTYHVRAEAGGDNAARSTPLEMEMSNAIKTRFILSSPF